MSDEIKVGDIIPIVQQGNIQTDELEVISVQNGYAKCKNTKGEFQTISTFVIFKKENT